MHILLPDPGAKVTDYSVGGYPQLTSLIIRVTHQKLHTIRRATQNTSSTHTWNNSSAWGHLLNSALKDPTPTTQRFKKLLLLLINNVNNLCKQR